MKKRYLISTAALGVLAIITMGPATGTAEVAQNTTSNITLKAVAGEETVTPVDPEHPSEPGIDEPGDGNETGQTGSLQLNYVSHLDFGNDIKITDKSVTAKAINKNTPYFQVSDLRGTGEGWSLRVSLGEFKAIGAESNIIKGATIAFNNGVAVTSNETDENAAESKNIVLTAGDTNSQPMMTATSGNGRGTWLTKYSNTSGTDENDQIKFNAPTNNIDANTQYTSQLTWQLTDSPAP